jgi:hypothetical protein
MLEGRRKRYAFAISVATVAIGVALYYAAEFHVYTNSDSWDFDLYEETFPDEFQPMLTGSGQIGKWIITEDKSSASPHILAYTPNDDGNWGYPMLIIPDKTYSNFRASVKFKIAEGEGNEVAGLVFRMMDKNRYYAIVADALNQRVTLFRYDGQVLLGIEESDVDISKNEWHTLTVEAYRTSIGGYLDEQKVIVRHDDSYFVGHIGFWTKKDSEVYFDELRIDY